MAVKYRKITTVQVVLEDDAEAVVEQMNVAMDRIWGTAHDL
jgi:hypothetical protein